MSSRLRVLLLLRSYPPDSTAVGKLAGELAQFLADKNWQVDVVCASAGDGMEELGNPAVHRAWSPRYNRQSHALRALALAGIYPSLFAKAWNAPRPDILLTLTDPPLLSVLGALLARHWKCPHVHWCQDVYPEVAEAAGVFLPLPFTRQLSTWSLRRAHAVIPVGRCMARLLIARGLSESSLFFIPNWTDPTLPIGQLTGVRDDLAAPEEKLAVYSGNLGLVHDFDTILEAAALLQKQGSPWRIAFLGFGPKRQEAEAKAVALANVSFRDPLPESDYRELLQTADAHVVTLGKKFAGTVVPSKMYPAVSSGRPVVFIGPEDSETALWLTETGAGKTFANGDAAGVAEFFASDCERPPPLSPQWQVPSREHSAGQIEALLRRLATSERDDRERGL